MLRTHYYFMTAVFFCLGFHAGLAQKSPEIVLTTGHNDMVSCTAFSPNGKYFASAGNNKIIKVWDVTTGLEFRTLSGNDGRINKLKFFPDGKRIGAIENHGNIKIWNIITGELLHQFKSNSSMTDFAILENENKIIHANTDGYLESYDLAQKKTIKTNEELYCVSITYNKSDSLIYAFNHKGFIHKVNTNKLRVIEKKQLYDSLKYPTKPPVLSKNGRFMAVTFIDNTFRVFNMKKLEETYSSAPRPEKIKSLDIDPEKPVLYYTSNAGNFYSFNYKKKKMLNKVSKKGNVFGYQTINRSPNAPIIAISSNDKIKFYNLQTKRFYKELKSKSNKMLNIAYDPSGKYLAGASDDINIRIWNLEQSKIDQKVPMFFPCAFSATGKYLYGSGKSINLNIYDVEKGEITGSMSTKGKLIKKLVLSPDGKFLAASTYTGKVMIYGTDNHKLIKTIQPLSGIISGLAFNKNGQYIAAGNKTGSGKVVIWDWKNDQKIAEPNQHNVAVGDVAFSRDGEYFASAGWDHQIFLYNTDNYKNPDTLKGHSNVINTIAFNDSSSLLASGATNNIISKQDNSIKVWDLKEKNELCSIKEHRDGVTEVLFEKGTNRIFSCGNDGLIKLSDPQNCHTIASFISVGSDGYAVVTNERYYTASEEALKNISFRIEGKLYPFEQFDLRLNRPDIVCSKIGKTPENLIKAYHYVYEKRLRRMGLNEETFEESYKIPKVKILNKNKLPVIVDKKNFSFKILAEDDFAHLDRLNVYINDVPIYGNEGIQVEGDIQSIQKTVVMNLIPGENEIQVEALNKKGNKSLKASYTVLYETAQKAGDLYLLSIGVSDYNDERFDLKYSAKDAQDMAQTMQKSKTLYKNIYTKKLLNEEVTVENFRALKSFFKDIKINDVVIIFMAGHGVLNADFEYYFGTHDMDFQNPEKKGLSYAEIDKLINAIPALKKLLIMDSCHSGEIDQEEVEKRTAPEVIEGDVNFRSVGAGIRQKNAFGIENSFQLMENLFSDIRKGSGATVISSSGGAELSMESDRWNNGLFTYCLLSGIKGRAADLNHDGQIQVSEVKKHVYKRVKKLSNGHQQPTARQTNIKMDYRIF